jgi:hypothetical protein
MYPSVSRRSSRFGRIGQFDGDRLLHECPQRISPAAFADSSAPPSDAFRSCKPR